MKISKKQAAKLNDWFHSEDWQDTLQPVNNKRIHEFVLLPKAFYEFADSVSTYIFFFNTKLDAVQKWLYYIGGENDSEIVFLDRTIGLIIVEIASDAAYRLEPNDNFSGFEIENA